MEDVKESALFPSPIPSKRGYELEYTTNLRACESTGGQNTEEEWYYAEAECKELLICSQGPPHTCIIQTYKCINTGACGYY